RARAPRLDDREPGMRVLPARHRARERCSYPGAITRRDHGEPATETRLNVLLHPDLRARAPDERAVAVTAPRRLRQLPAGVEGRGHLAHAEGQLGVAAIGEGGAVDDIGELRREGGLP